jgi:hypothetical protein
MCTRQVLFIIFVKRRGRGEVRVHSYGENEFHVVGVLQDLVYDILLVRDKKAALKLNLTESEYRKPWTKKDSYTRYVLSPLLPPPLLVSTIILSPLIWVFIRHCVTLLNSGLRRDKVPSSASPIVLLDLGSLL